MKNFRMEELSSSGQELDKIEDKKRKVKRGKGAGDKWVGGGGGGREGVFGGRSLAIEPLVYFRAF
jgi:hypothetical protein